MSTRDKVQTANRLAIIMSEISKFGSLEDLFNHPYFIEEASNLKLILHKHKLDDIESNGLQLYLMKERLSRAKKLWTVAFSFRENRALQRWIQESLKLKEIISINNISEDRNRHYSWLITHNRDPRSLGLHRHLIDELYRLINGIWNEFIEEIEEWDTEFFDSLLNWGS